MAAVVAPQNEKACVQVESATWVSDARDLFDYEVASARARDFDLPSSAKITRVGTSLMPLERHAPLPDGGEALLQLSKRGDSFWVDSAAPSTGSGGARLTASKKLWLVVKDLAAPYALSEGDVFRMGCSRFRVRQLVANPDSGVRPDVTLPDSATVCSPCEGPEDAAGAVCRICLEGGDDEELGPLIQPCACKGSVQSVHRGCLQQWINCRLGLTDNESLETYVVRPLDCDLCKRPYPSHVIEGGGCRRPLVRVPQPNGPFIVLEMLARSRNSASSGVLVGTVADEEKPLTFGRAHSVGFKVDDISMSRCHAKIRFRQGQFFLEDNRSRFGTLVCMRRPYVLSPGAAVSIQCGSTVLSLTLKHDGAAPISCLREDARDHCSECSTEDDVSA